MSVPGNVDTVLSLDPGPHDILYRIQRMTGKHQRVLYVTVEDPSIIPEDKRTHGSSVVKELSKLDAWNELWTTLCVYREGGTIRCKLDSFQPHALPKEYVLDKYALYNMTDCDTVRELNHRVSKVWVDGQACVLKIARFPFEMPALQRELRAYYSLPEGSPAPRLVGYVFEEHADRVVGFLVEFLEGRPAEIVDAKPCWQALDQLHRHLIHGDICRYNILITPQGPKFIDFENSIVRGSDKWSTMLRDAEIQGLAHKLVDTSEAGRPYYYSKQS